MKKPYFLTLLSKKLRNEISRSEDEQLQHGIQHNDAFKGLANALGGYFRAKRDTTPHSRQCLEKTWEMIGQADESFAGKYDYTAQVSPSRQFLKIAAVFVIIISAATLSYYSTNRKADTKFSSLTASNTRIFKTLDDGTRIWLNQNSSLRYNEGFGKARREVFLNGEAFFDVAKNSRVSLVIHARNIDITVKGTAFNVNAYRGLSDIEVSLIRGSIEVSHRLNKQKVSLKPREKLIVSDELDGQGGAFRVVYFPSLNLLKGLEWTNDSLVFRKEKLKDLALQLEKKYSVKIDIRNEQLKNKRFSGTFADEGLNEALEALKLSYPFSYTVNNKLIIIDK